MGSESKYFPLSMEQLRAIGRWTADCAERALPVYEARARSDSRPRAAIDEIRLFAGGGRRTARLRTLALEAIAAASAYTHPLADVGQTKHIVGPVAYAALALELQHGGATTIGDGEVGWAIEHAPLEVGEVLRQMPARQAGKSRLDMLLYALDAGIRGWMAMKGDGDLGLGGR